MNEKPIYRGDCLKRGGSWKVCEFKRVLGNKEGVVFLMGGGVDTPMPTMVAVITDSDRLIFPF